MNEHLASSPSSHPDNGASDIHRWALTNALDALPSSDSLEASGVDDAPRPSLPTEEELFFASVVRDGSMPDALAPVSSDEDLAASEPPQVAALEGPSASVAPLATSPDASEPTGFSEPDGSTAAEPPATLEASELAPTSVGPAAPAKLPSRARLVLLPIVCALAALGGVALAAKVDDYGRATRMADISAQVDGIRTEQDRARVELEKQSASLATTREAMRGLAGQQREAEVAVKTVIGRVEGEQVRLAREIAATRHAQARTEEHVYQLGEALKLIDWATTGGSATGAANTPTPPSVPTRSTH